MHRDPRYAHAKSFDDMGKILFQDPQAGLTIRRGNIFEMKTVKGNTNLIIAMMVKDGFLIYLHGDKARKVSMYEFINAVMSGDAQPRSAKEIDSERLSMASIGLDAIANRRTGEEQIKYMGDQAQERYMYDMSHSA